MNGFDYIEADNRKILNYGWVNFPLAYVQVATLSVYAYLLSSLLGKVSKVFKGSIIMYKAVHTEGPHISRILVPKGNHENGPKIFQKSTFEP